MSPVTVTVQQPVDQPVREIRFDNDADRSRHVRTHVNAGRVCFDHYGDARGCVHLTMTRGNGLYLNAASLREMSAGFVSMAEQLEAR